ncbi:hypothetical protein L195_g049503, partial [Trifolium pratense]
SVSCEQSNNLFLSAPKVDSETENNSCPMEKNLNSSEVSRERTNEEIEDQEANESSKVDGMERNSDSPGLNFGMKQTPNTKKSKKEEREEENRILLERKRQHWAELRKKNIESHRHRDHGDSIDYEAVRTAKPDDIAAVINTRGQQHIIGGKIQAALNKIKDSDGRMDLEWLRKIEPKEVK